MDYLNEEEEAPYFSRPYGGESPTVVSKIGLFIEKKQIGVKEFWQSDRNYASAQDLVSFCKNSGLHLPEYDIINLKNEIFSNKETIYLEQFISYVPYWEQQDKEGVQEFLKKRSEELLTKIQTK